MIKGNCAMLRERVNEFGEAFWLCEGLNELVCEKGECRFFKTKEQIEEQRKKARARMGELESE